MSVVWTAVRKSLQCKSNPSEVYDPGSSKSRFSCFKPKSGRFASEKTCKSAIRNVIHGRKILKEHPTTCSPLCLRSSDLINPVTHHVTLTNSGLRIRRDHTRPRPGGSHILHSFGSISPKLSSLDSGSWTDEFPRSSFRQRMSMNGVQNGYKNCPKCAESLARQDAETHFLTKHAVTQLLEEDSSRKIIEIIFMTGWTASTKEGPIERILKVHNPQTKVAQFEENREMVKIRAHRQQYSRRHSRCLADGNELLRFYGTTLACPLGQNGSSSLCPFQTCNVCSILRYGFSSQKDGVFGVYTTSTSEIAYNSIKIGSEEGRNTNKALRKALIVCRVIAGRVHKPMVETTQGLIGGRMSGFDSLAGKLGSSSSHIEELYLLKSTALLPCFVIICKH